MKRLIVKLVAAACICSVIMSCLVLGASAAGSTSLSFSKSSVTVGETVTVRVNFTANEVFFGVEGMLKYNSAVLQFVSGSGVHQGAAGAVKMAVQADSSRCTVEMTFKAIGVGTSSVSVYDCIYSNADSETPMIGSSANISVTDASKNVSADASLKSLRPSAGTLYPAFSPNTVSYTVNVDFGVTQCLISAVSSDPAAKWDVTGSKDLKVGKNVRTVVVTAPNGTKKNYTVTINRAAEDGASSVDNTPDESEVPDNTTQEISVLVDGQNKIIAKELSENQKLVGFEVGEFIYNGTVVPAYINEKSGLMALMLSDPVSAQGEFYFYNMQSASFEKVLVEKFGNNSYIMLGAEGEAPDGFVEAEAEIHQKTVRVFKSESTKLSDFNLLYMINKDGEKLLYIYDAYEDTVLRYCFENTQQAEAVVQQPKNFGDYETVAKILLIVSGVLLMLVVTLSMLLLVKKSQNDSDDYFDDDDYDGDDDGNDDDGEGEEDEDEDEYEYEDSPYYDQEEDLYMNINSDNNAVSKLQDGEYDTVVNGHAESESVEKSNGDSDDIIDIVME